MANADAINQVIASIKGEIEATKSLGFNMNYSIVNDELDKSPRNCGTVACIAGHAYINAIKADKREIYRLGADGSGWNDLFDTAQEKLGLSYEERELLFFGENEEGESVIYLENITPEHAIRTLEHLRDNDVVDWSV